MTSSCLLSSFTFYSAFPRKILEAGGVEVETVVLPDGEEFKTLEILTKILDKALTARLDRKCTFVALGGGVIGDMVGFAAAIYQRGVNFVQVRRGPTDGSKKPLWLALHVIQQA